jgi:hypothetical protein
MGENPTEMMHPEDPCEGRLRISNFPSPEKMLIIEKLASL